MGARKHIAAEKLKEARKNLYFAKLVGVPSSPRKMRYVVDMIRGMEVNRALGVLRGANGWYHYESRFGLSVYSENGEVERYNVFHVYMIVRHDKNGRKYLYDIINIKKETSTPLSY